MSPKETRNIALFVCLSECHIDFHHSELDQLKKVYFQRDRLQCTMYKSFYSHYKTEVNERLKK